jgi:hypothetical protein
VHGAAACVTLKTSPAIVRVPERPLVCAFGATVKLTVPVPLPDSPAVTVIHGTADVAVHAHPPSDVTVARPDPPSEATDWLSGATE